MFHGFSAAKFLNMLQKLMKLLSFLVKSVTPKFPFFPGLFLTHHFIPCFLYPARTGAARLRLQT